MNKLLLLVVCLVFSLGVSAQTDLIISEYVEGWSNNKAIEVYNPTSSPINLKNYRLTRYSNGADTPPAETSWYIVLPDVELKPYKTYVCVLDKRNPNGTGQEAPVWDALADRADVFLCPDYNISKALYHNGDDAIALEKLDGTLVDLFARWGAPRPAEAALPGSTTKVRAWTDTAPYFTGAGIGITADHTLVRKSNVLNGVKSNPASFNPLAEYDSLSANTFNYLGWHKSDVAPANATPVFEKNEYEFKVWKQADAGTTVGTVKATDAENDVLRYYINRGNFVYNASDVRKVPFGFDKSTGKITVADPSALLESTWDTIFMKVSVNDGFSETLDWINVNVILSATNVSSPLTTLPSGNLQILPNPTASRNITLKAQKAISQVAVFNASGQVFYEETFAIGKYMQTAILERCKPGIYLVKVTYSDQQSETQRLILK
jgi:hypothetical protein